MVRLRPAELWYLITVFRSITWAKEKAPGDRDASQVRYRLEEEPPIGTQVGNLVHDAELRKRYGDEVIKELRFRFVADTVQYFNIGVTSGILVTTAKIDRDSALLCRQKEVCEVHLSVVIQPVQYLHIIKVIVEILDANDNSPTFKEPRFFLQINEAAAVGSSYVLPTASDWDSPSKGVKKYELSPQSSVFGLLVTEKLDGSKEVKLVLNERLDRETNSQFNLELIAFDGGTSVRKGSADVTVRVLDSNDNKPEFSSTEYRVSIPENTPIGRVILQVKATDKDIGPAGDIDYGFAVQTQALHGSLFGIRNSSGNIYVKGTLDHEKATVYHLVVTAQDRGPDSIATESTVIILIEDLNDNSPVVTTNTLGAGHGPGAAAVVEDSPVGSFVAQVRVSDPDSGANGLVNCTLNGDAFTLVQKYATEYQVVTAVTLDRERVPLYSVTLSCQDAGTVPKTTEVQLQVSVLDVNDNAPVFMAQTYKGVLTENNFIWASVLQVTASDWDDGDNGRIQYVIPGNTNATFHIDQRGVISAQESVDREQYDTFRFPILAVDMGRPPRTGSALVIITIEDLNDERPLFHQATYIFNVSENEPMGTRVGTVAAEDRDSPQYGAFVYSFASGHVMTEKFSIDAHAGSITTRRPLDREAQEVYHLTVMARDLKNGAMFGTASVTVTVSDLNDNAPVFDYPTPANNTLYISNLLPPGHFIIRVTARDLDSNENGKMTFSLSDISGVRWSTVPEASSAGSSSRPDYFRIDPDTGTVFVQTSLHGVEHRVFHLAVVVRDRGLDYKSTSAELVIVVNRTFPIPPGLRKASPSSSESAFFLHRLLPTGSLVYIIISVVIGCVVVVAASLVALVVARHRRRGRSRPPARNGRMETTLRALMTKDPALVVSSREGTPVELIDVNGRQGDDCQAHQNNGNTVETTTPIEVSATPSYIRHLRRLGVVNVMNERASK